MMSAVSRKKGERRRWRDETLDAPFRLRRGPDNSPATNVTGHDCSSAVSGPCGYGFPLSQRTGPGLATTLLPVHANLGRYTASSRLAFFSGLHGLRSSQV